MKKVKKGDNSIKIGQKSATVYAVSALTQLQSGTKEIVFQARGRMVKTLIDSIEVLKSRFHQEVQLTKFVTGTDTVKFIDKESHKERTARVSTLEVTIKSSTKKNEQ